MTRDVSSPPPLAESTRAALPSLRAHKRHHANIPLTPSSHRHSCNWHTRHRMRLRCGCAWLATAAQSFCSVNFTQQRAALENKKRLCGEHFSSPSFYRVLSCPCTRSLQPLTLTSCGSSKQITSVPAWIFFFPSSAKALLQLLVSLFPWQKSALLLLGKY